MCGPAGLHPALWLLGAALCVPLSESVDALIFYGMGRSAGCPVKLAGCFDAAYIGEFYYKLGPAGAPVQLKLMYDAGMKRQPTRLLYNLEGSGQHHGLHRLCSGRPGL